MYLLKFITISSCELISDKLGETSLNLKNTRIEKKIKDFKMQK